MSAEVRTPRGDRWERVGPTPMGTAWRRGRFLAISSLKSMELPTGAGVGPTWHVSISRRGRRRPTAQECGRILRAFGIQKAEEDNHHPGVARQFFVPVDPAHRAECECKVDEDVVVEPDGFRWTNPRGATQDPALCRGCKYERLSGRACPIHGGPQEGANT